MRKANITRMHRTDGHVIRHERRARRSFRHRSWVWFLKRSASIWTACLLLIACGGRVEDGTCPHTGTGLTAVAWCNCLLMSDGSTKCVALADPKQLDECWWNDVVSVVASHELAEDGTCSL